jgi:predicted DNA-binding transcriptional regulator AlpA
MVERVTPQQAQQPRLQRIVRKKDLPQFTGLQRTAIDEAIKAGLLKVTKLGERAVGVFEDDLIAYQQRLKNPNAGQPSD